MEGSLPSTSPDSPLQVLRLQGVGLTGKLLMYSVFFSAHVCGMIHAQV